MSSPPVRRADKLMPQAKLDELLSTGYCGHLTPQTCSNSHPKPFIWIATASDILATVTRAKAARASAAR